MATGTPEPNAPASTPPAAGGSDEGEDIQGGLSRDRLGQVVLADDSRKEGGPGGPGQRRGPGKHGDQGHERHDRVEEDERDRGCHLAQAPNDQQPPGVMSVHQPPDRAGEQQQRNGPRGQQDTDLEGAGAVRLQAQGQGDDRHPVAERRHHATHEDDAQVPTPATDV